MVAHLIGNGPSKKFFVNQPKGDVYGCNFGTHGMKLKATFIHDKRPFNHLIKHNQKLAWPAITAHGRNPAIANKIKAGSHVPQLIQLPTKIKERSSGHDGVAFLATCGRYKEIHLWGFDSLTANSCDSDSSGKIDGSVQDQKRVSIWNKRFRQQFTLYCSQGIEFFIHKDTETVQHLKSKDLVKPL